MALAIALKRVPDALTTVWRCKLKPIEPRDESAWSQRLKPNFDEPLSNVAFSFNVRRYTTVDAAKRVLREVGRCRLKPLETRVETTS
jgi:hypothetical protein